MQDDEFAQKLVQLKGFIEDFEYIEIIELLDTMLEGCGEEKAEHLRKISDYVQNFEYDEALSMIGRML